MFVGSAAYFTTQRHEPLVLQKGCCHAAGTGLRRFVPWGRRGRHICVRIEAYSVPQNRSCRGPKFRCQPVKSASQLDYNLLILKDNLLWGANFFAFFRCRAEKLQGFQRVAVRRSAPIFRCYLNHPARR
jgi:hypothetical protein